MDFHFVINPDIIVEGDTIGELVTCMERQPEIGLITPRVLNPDGTEQYLPKFGPSIRYSFIGNLPGMKFLRRKIGLKDLNYIFILLLFLFY